MQPEDVGVPSTSLIMGKLSGRNAFRDKLESLGYVLEAPALNDAFKRFKDLADKKKHVFDEDIIALVDDQLAGQQEKISLTKLRVMAGTEGPQSAEIELSIEGEIRSTTATGNGPVDAVFNGIRQLCPHTAVLELYQVNAVTEGTDAQATVSVRLADQGLVATGKASDPDTLVASARAYVHALNKLEVRRAKAMAA
jgi:2-isopropylmalate synthase